MSTQPIALLLAEKLEQQFPLGTAQHYLDGEAAAELRRLHAENEELLSSLQTILNISLMDNGHWAKTIEAEASAAIRARGQK
jgi:hypothetical protein